MNIWLKGIDTNLNFPRMDTLIMTCKNTDLLRETLEFFKKLGAKIEAEIPFASIRYPTPFISPHELFSGEYPNPIEVTSVLSGKPVAQSGDDWSTALMSVLGFFLNGSESVNKSVESKNLAPSDLMNEINKVLQYMPQNVMLLRQNFRVLEPLIVAFLLTFILNEFSLSKEITVYRGITAHAQTDIAKETEDARKTMSFIEMGFKELFRDDVFGPHLGEIDKLQKEFIIHKKVLGINDSRIIDRFEKLPLKKIFTESYLERHSNDSEQILSDIRLNAVLNAPSFLEQKITNINSERTRLFLENLKNKGDTVTSIRFWSSSLVKAWAAGEFFSGGDECCLLKITVPKGAKAMFVSGRHIEAEILLSPCSRYEFLEKDEENQIIKLRYLNSLYQNTPSDWALFKSVLKEYVINTSLIKMNDNMYDRGQWVLFPREKIIKIEKYLKCMKA
jgi:hypothetical protein